MRTNGQVALTRNFGGVRQTGDTIEDRTMEIHGLTDNPRTSLRRIPGKVLATTGPGLGPVYNLQQLRFRDTFSIFGNFGGNLTYERTYMPYPGFRIDDPFFDLEWTPLPPYPPAYEPQPEEEWFIPPYNSPLDPPDWPQGFLGFSTKFNEQEKQKYVFDNNPLSGGPGLPNYDYSLAYTPSSFSFSVVAGGPLPAVQDLSVQITGTWPALILGVVPSINLAEILGVFLRSSELTPDPTNGLLDQDWGVRIISTAITTFGLNEGFIYINVSEGIGKLTITEEIPVSINVIEPNWSLTSPTISHEFIAGDDSGDLVNDTVTLDNTESPIALEWTAAHSISGVTVIPDNGTVAAGGTQDVIIRFDPLGLAAATYDGVVTFTGNYDDPKLAAVSYLIYPKFVGSPKIKWEDTTSAPHSYNKNHTLVYNGAPPAGRRYQYYRNLDGAKHNVTLYRKTDGSWVLLIVDQNWGPHSPYEVPVTPTFRESDGYLTVTPSPPPPAPFVTHLICVIGPSVY